MIERIRSDFRTGPFVALLTLLLLLAPLARRTPAAAEGESAESEKTPLTEEEKKKLKPQPFRFSAWSAFRDFTTAQVAPPEMDEKRKAESLHTRPGSGNWTCYARRGKWLPLVVELENTTEKTDYSGTMSIQLDPTRENNTGIVPYTSRYRQDFELPPGGKKLYHFSVLCPEFPFGEIIIDISANGTTFKRHISIRDLDQTNDRLVVVVSDQAGAFKYLLSKRERGALDPELGIDPGAAPEGRQVAVVSPEDLPDRWHDLLLADLIIIDGPPTEHLKDDQLAALETYVQAGGHLLISSGGDPARLKTPDGQTRSLADLAGVKVRGAARIPSLDQVAPAFKPANPEATIPIVDVSMAPGVNRIVKRNASTGNIELAERELGMGTVTFLAFSLNDPLLATWEGRESLPLGILNFYGQRPLFQFSFQEAEGRQVNNNWFGDSETVYDKDDLPGLRRSLDESFANDTPVETPERNTVASFLLLFLLFAVPGNYFVFGWFRRREIAWLAVPLYAVAFSILAWYVGYTRGKFTLNEVTVVEAGTRQSSGVARTFLALYAPSRDEYDIDFGSDKVKGETLQAAPGHLVSPTQGQTRAVERLPEMRVRDESGKLSIEDLLVQARDTRRLEVVHRVDLDDGIDATLRENTDGSGYTLRLRNGSPFHLLNAALLVPDERGNPRGYFLADDVAPNAREPEERQLPATTGPGWSARLEEAFFGRSIVFRMARGQDAQNRKNALVQYVQKRVNARVRDQGQGFLAAWIDGGLLPLQVDGETPERQHGFSLLLLPIAQEFASGNGGQPGNLRIQYAPLAPDLLGEYGGMEETKFRPLPPRAEFGRMPSGEGTCFLALQPAGRLRGVSNPVLSFAFNLSAPEPSGETKNFPTSYRGDLKVEVETVRGNNRRWETVQVPIRRVDLIAGGKSIPVSFTLPLKPAMYGEKGILKLKITLSNLISTGGRLPDEDMTWPAGLIKVQGDIQGKDTRQ